MITALPNRAYPNDSVKSSLFACISLKCLLKPTVIKTHINKRMNFYFFFNMQYVWENTYYILCLWPYLHGLSCFPSTKQVTRMGMKLHLQSNSFQIKKTQVLHLITIAICSIATNSNSTREREREKTSQT